MLLQAAGLESGLEQDVWFVYAWVSVVVPVVALVLARRISRVPEHRVRAATLAPLLVTGVHVGVVIVLFAWIT